MSANQAISILVSLIVFLIVVYILWRVITMIL